MPLPESDIVQGDELYTQVYEQLRRIAAAKLSGERKNHTLQATALVNEAYLKLKAHPALAASDSSRFFYVAAEAMRQILVDHARGKGRKKRGGGKVIDVTDVAELAAEMPSEEILALEEALCRLEQTEPRSAAIIKLRFFAGLSVEETAKASGLSVRTVIREWNFGRAWLFKALQ